MSFLKFFSRLFTRRRTAAEKARTKLSILAAGLDKDSAALERRADVFTGAARNLLVSAAEDAKAAEDARETARSLRLLGN